MMTDFTKITEVGGTPAWRRARTWIPAFAGMKLEGLVMGYGTEQTRAKSFREVLRGFKGADDEKSVAHGIKLNLRISQQLS